MVRSLKGFRYRAVGSLVSTRRARFLHHQCPLAYVNIISPELEIMAWKHNSYLDPAVEGPPCIIPLTSILSQACRLTLTVPEARAEDVASDDEDSHGPVPRPSASPGMGAKVWITAGLTRVWTSINCVFFTNNMRLLLMMLRTYKLSRIYSDRRKGTVMRTRFMR